MMNLNCQHFTQQQCRSCQWLEKDKFEQISLKEEDLKRLISPFICKSDRNTTACNVGDFTLS